MCIALATVLLDTDQKTFAANNDTGITASTQYVAEKWPLNNGSNIATKA